MTTPLTPERKAANDASLAAYEAAAKGDDYTALWATFAEVECRVASEARMFCGAEHTRLFNEMNRITRERRHRRADARQFATAAE